MGFQIAFQILMIVSMWKSQNNWAKNTKDWEVVGEYGI